MDPLFVPTLYSLVINSLPVQKLNYTIGTETGAVITRQNIPDISSLIVTRSDSTGEFIPSVTVGEGNKIKINFQDFFDKAGHYMVKSSGQTVSAISMNYNRLESELNCLSPSELIAGIEKYHLDNCSVYELQTMQFSQIKDEIQYGRRLWKFFLLTALFFILAEAAIIRFWR